MPLEIERKFLVKSNPANLAEKSVHIRQGYLARTTERTVRVRVAGDRGFLTIKGRPEKKHITRFEWEVEIPLMDAEDLLRLCLPEIIDKMRHYISFGDHVFEVDVFYGDNRGLIIAEAELKSEDEEIQKPDWLGKEVTGDKRYYNAMLIKNPYKTWSK